ncbi:MAG TPA: hypothetical protein VNA65_07225 [Candidatus Dormibacteraeota bacterium]|nr:hypothetical protein [Candidatus Dormibacteraeota bacterium]
MRARHALFAGFGLGGLVVLVAVVLLGGNGVISLTKALRPTPTSSPESSPSPSPAPTPATSIEAGPGPRAGAVFVFDPENHGVILFGGSKVVPQPDGTNPSVTLDDTWLWNGKSWRKLDVQGPPARSAAVAAYDSARHVIVVFGGSGPTGAGQARLLQDTWTWDGRQWQQLHPVHSPNPRFDAAFAFDEARGEGVLYGGEGDTTIYNATWTWDGADWTLQDPKTVPPARRFPSMAYDAARSTAVLFGGSLPGVRFNDTWLWDGTNWSQSTAPAPAASGWSEMVYDSAHSQIVAYVYFGLDNHPVAEYTITWDGKGWTDRTTASDPSPRAIVSLAYDPEIKQVVLYGPGDELWTWDGSSWSR